MAGLKPLSTFNVARMACVATVYCRSNFFPYLSLTMWGKVGPLLDEMVCYNPWCCARSSQCVAKGKDKNGFFSCVHLASLRMTIILVAISPSVPSWKNWVLARLMMS